MEGLCRELGDKGKALAIVQTMESALSASAVCTLPEELLPLLQSGGDEAEDNLAAALEHALQVLEGLPMSTPRKARKAARALCERVETALDDKVKGDLVRQLALCEVSELIPLATALVKVQGLRVGESGIECVEAFLDELSRCGDAVVELRDRGEHVPKRLPLSDTQSVTATLEPADEQQPKPAAGSSTGAAPALLVGMGVVAAAAVATVHHVTSRRLQP